MSFETDGIRIERGLVAHSAIMSIRRGIFEIMRPHCCMDPNDPDAIDKGFVSLRGRTDSLKQNCYRLFGKLAAVPRLLADPGIARIIAELGFTDAAVQSHSVFCLEPGNLRNTFLPHQDLRDRTSLNALLIWVPLSAGPDIGGMACYEASHREGPRHHRLSPEGKPYLTPEHYADCRRIELVNYLLGDCVFISPFLIHESIQNRGMAVRWTAVIKLDSVIGLNHVKESIYPFPIDEYIDLRTNEQRLNPAPD
ncbi:MAG: hypothetical protein EXQ99_03585 [Alphaproteobacteria bacterium]|nr:hypothetical protein [Alphaproteobacteria bacterium]